MLAIHPLGIGSASYLQLGQFGVSPNMQGEDAQKGVNFLCFRELEGRPSSIRNPHPEVFIVLSVDVAS